MIYGRNKSNLDRLMKLNYATKCILRTCSRRAETILLLPNQDYDEESPPFVGNSIDHKTSVAEDRGSKTLVKTILSRLTVQGYEEEEPPPSNSFDSRCSISFEDSPPRLSTHISWVQQKDPQSCHIDVKAFLSMIISYSEAGGDEFLASPMGKLTFLSKLKWTSSIVTWDKLSANV